jgi:hypothetical protein
LVSPHGEAMKASFGRLWAVPERPLLIGVAEGW